MGNQGPAQSLLFHPESTWELDNPQDKSSKFLQSSSDGIATEHKRPAPRIRVMAGPSHPKIKVGVLGATGGSPLRHPLLVNPS